jgi:hypothetical protein
MAKLLLHTESEIGRLEDGRATIECSTNATSSFYCTTDTAMELSM